VHFDAQDFTKGLSDSMDKVGIGIVAGGKDMMHEFASLANLASKGIIPIMKKVADISGSKMVKTNVTGLTDQMESSIQESLDYWKLTEDEQKKLKKAGTIGVISKEATKFVAELPMGGIGKAIGKGLLVKTTKTFGPMIAKSATKMGKYALESVPTVEKITEKFAIQSGKMLVKSTEKMAESVSEYKPPEPPAIPVEPSKAGLKAPLLAMDMHAKAPKIPLMEASKPSADTKPVEKNITIQVNATEKDLSQRIANEVRAVLYKSNLNNLG
jgi:hypothetical protein